MAIALWIAAAAFAPLAFALAPLQAPQPASRPTLDFEFFKAEVQPIFLNKRAGFTRCVVCHSAGGPTGFLEPLSAGVAAWNEEQSRRNFERVSKLVTPGEPMKSVLIRHPLEPAAGGDEFHNGGRQFASQDDPQFKTLAAWIRGQRSAGPAR